MPDPQTRSCTAFIGQRLLSSGPLPAVAIAVARRPGSAEAVLVFEDATGRVVDLDLRGTDAEIVARLQPSPAAPGDAAPEDGQRGRGRPKLGVIPREVTLLPRQWDWLATQPGGASATLRRLVEAARTSPPSPRQRRRMAQEAAYRFMQAMAGDLPGYEEATRALFADDQAGLAARIAGWPADVQAYALRLAAGPAMADAAAG